MADMDKTKNGRDYEDNEAEESELLTLEFDDGKELECEIMGVFESNGKEYIALIPNDGSDDVYIYGYHEVSDEEFELVDINDEAEFKAAVAEFENIIETSETEKQ